MAAITVKDLSPDYSFGSIVHGVTWDTLNDESVRQQLRDIFEDRGLIVFEGVEASGKMQAEISKVFGPLKDHPTASTPRVTEDYVPGLIDMHSQPRDISDGDLRIRGDYGLGYFEPGKKIGEVNREIAEEVM